VPSAAPDAVSAANAAGLRLAVDIGGTFTDLVVDEGGVLSVYKSPSTPEDPVHGMLNVIAVAAAERGQTRTEFLAGVGVVMHATTRAINAILTGKTAKTALVTTEGHRDVLVFREGGRTGPFDFSRPYPEPYVPRGLTYEVRERIGADGVVVRALDEDAVREVAIELSLAGVEAVAVCLLWSITNPDHELRVEELLHARLPGIPITLSHRVNPAIREYRRASCAAIDASLKPVMTSYLAGMERRLRAAGLHGQLLMVTSTGGVAPMAAIAAAPIHSVNSGPSMAPIAGRYYATRTSGLASAVVADTGGTSFDVSLVRKGDIPRTRESWIGDQYYGHITGFSAVDVKSIGAGGGSVAWVDDGGLLHVGPDSAGSDPGPACYGRGGRSPTVTDASLILGYLDARYFLGGTMPLDVGAAEAAMDRDVAQTLGLDIEDAAAAVIKLATDHMVRAIEDITVNQGIDPTSAVLVAGGGAAGLNAVAIAARLGCREVIVPPTGAALSAAGALLSDMRAEVEQHFVTTTAAFDFLGAARVVADLRRKCQEFIAAARDIAPQGRVELAVEARYPDQVWELEVPIRASGIETPRDLRDFQESFHALHRDVFAISEPDSPIEMIGWRGSAVCELKSSSPAQPRSDRGDTRLALAAEGAQTSALASASRRVVFAESGAASARVARLSEIMVDAAVEGPAIIESPFTTVVVEPGSVARRRGDGSIVVTPPRQLPMRAVISDRPRPGSQKKGAL
jgi:N-methylhydantoinase A